MRKILLRAAISVFFLVLLYFIVREDIPLIIRALSTMDHGRVALATGIFLTTVLVMARRLQIIFRAKGLSVGFVESANLTFVGYFFNNFLPTSVGGDIVKALCAARITKSAVKSVTSVLMDRIFGLFTFILIPSVTLFFFMSSIGNPMIPIVVYTLLAFSLVCFFFIFNRSVARRFRFVEEFMDRFGIGKKLRQLYDHLHDFRNHKAAVLWAMGLSMIGQSISIFVLFLLAGALGSDASPMYFFLLVPVVHLVSMLPSLNGLGIREGAYIYFLQPYVGREVAAALGLLWLGLLFLLSVIGGVIYLIRHDYHIRFKEAAIKEELEG